MRHLRRTGLLRQAGKTGRSRKRKSAVDLIALKRAQDLAASKGERIPLLDDLDDTTFFSRIKRVGASEYAEEAMQEVMELMAVKPTDPRSMAVRQRLEKALVNHKDKLIEGNNARLRALGLRERGSQGDIEEFLRIAVEEVGPKRNLRTFPTTSAGRQTLRTFRKGEHGISSWSLDIIEATIDHIDGLRWNEIDPDRKRVVPPPQSQFATLPEQEPETTKTIPLEETLAELKDKVIVIEQEPAITYPEDSVELPMTLEVTTENHIRERYAEVLLAILEKEGSASDEKVLARLDKLAGIA